jgi:small subunit ribosomal protein S16
LAVRIRFKRMGRLNRPFYRLVATDSRTPRDGRTLERLGFWDPLVESGERAEKVDAERVKYWLSVGARPTWKAQLFLRRHGILVPQEPRRVRRRARRRRGGAKSKA